MTGFRFWSCTRWKPLRCRCCSVVHVAEGWVLRFRDRAKWFGGVFRACFRSQETVFSKGVLQGNWVCLCLLQCWRVCVNNAAHKPGSLGVQERDQVTSLCERLSKRGVECANTTIGHNARKLATHYAHFCRHWFGQCTSIFRTFGVPASTAIQGWRKTNLRFSSGRTLPGGHATLQESEAL